jgi:hypothetical protein
LITFYGVGNVLQDSESNENWFSRAKTEADKGVPRNDRVAGIAIVVVSFLLMLYFIAHQTESTGFFTSTFGPLEMVMLYGNLTAWIITGPLEGFFGQRLLSRIFDAFGGIIFMVVSLAWLLVVFPFDFSYFANVLPVSLRFLVQWISNGIAQGVMVLVVILLAVAAVYSPIAYKFDSVKRFSRKK